MGQRKAVSASKIGFKDPVPTIKAETPQPKQTKSKPEEEINTLKPEALIISPKE